MHATHIRSLLINATALSLLTCVSLIYSSAEEKKLNVSMDSIISMCKKLHARIKDDKFTPDLLIGLARGGLVPLGLLAGEGNFNNRNTRTIDRGH